MEGVAGTSGATITDVDSESSGSVSSVRSRRAPGGGIPARLTVCHFTSDTDEPAPKDTSNRRPRERASSLGPTRTRTARPKEDLRVRADCAGNRKEIGQSEGNFTEGLNRVLNLIIRYVEQPESAAIARLDEERKKAKEESARLEATVKGLQEENASLRRRLESRPGVESALMGPAHRPTLAHERKAAPGDTQLPVTSGFVGGAPNNGKPAKNKGKGKAKGPAEPAPPLSAPATGPSSAPPTAVPGPSRAPAKPGGKKKQTKKDTPAQAAPEPRPLPPAPTSMETPWVVVAKRTRKKERPAPTSAANTQPPQSTRRAEPKLRPPRSAAVIISLTPAAVAKGMTYKGVLTDAQNRVDLTGLDITRLRPKFAATGAPMYEVPGANSEEGRLPRRKAEGVFRRVGRYQNLPAHEDQVAFFGFRPEAVVEGCKPNDEDVAKEITGAMPMEVAAEFARPLSLDTDSSEWLYPQSTSDTDEPAPKTQAIDGRMRDVRPQWASTSASRKRSWSVTGFNGKPRGRRREELEDQLQFIKSPVPRVSDTEEDRPILKEDLQALNWVTDKIVKYVEQPESAVIALEGNKVAGTQCPS
ncbi:neurofilament heavy polypeptide-like [Manduca sexta]|uniref:neurofilament heavy polypeptide-like n=1 Tax=Manduca sexta TaxID=7130 RepID=UPI00188E23AF|nr:neurofilament heavy polypeptide-like [Manduca sexta]